MTDSDPPDKPKSPAALVAVPGVDSLGRDGEERQERKARKKAEKQAKKEAKRLRDAHRPLTAWERYRALTDAFDMEQELVDLADHKARFAMVIMGALNVVIFVAGTRVEVLQAIPPGFRPWLGAYLFAYALVAFYFFIQAIESLRPREGRPNVPDPGQDARDEYPMGVRFFEDVLVRDIGNYHQAWREIRIGQLNAEIAVQVHVLARINQAKYGALRRLYSGLRTMTLMAAGLLMVIPGFVFAQQWKEARIKGTYGSNGMPNVLGTPTRLSESGVLEPSGVVFHPGRGRFFVVGDEGALSEVDTTGRVLGTVKIKGNIEDVAVHGPSGQLVLLSEKRSELILFDIDRQEEKTRWHIDPAVALGEEPGDKNQGFEGLAFREEAGKPGGGVFYLTHQRSPAALVALTLDPSSPGGEVPASAILGRWSLSNKDLTALTYAPGLGRLLVVADAKDRLVVVRPDGTVEDEVFLPGIQQEGVAMDATGDLWIADEQAGLLRFPGAADALAELIERRRAPRPPGGTTGLDSAP